jgi:hypothetical protein
MAALLVCGFALLGAAPERGSPVSRISDGPTASEYWDLEAIFEGNHRLFVRFLITNEWPGDALATVVGHFVWPDGRISPFRNGRLPGNWTLGEGGRWLEVGGSRLDLSSSEFALDVAKKKAGVQIHLRMQTPERASVGPELPGIGIDVLALAAPTEGTVWFRGMAEPLRVRGHTGITHTWADRRESERFVRRIDFFGRDGALALYLGESLAPDGTRAQVLTVEKEGRTILDVTEITVSHGEEKTSDLGVGYPVPKQLSLSGSKVSGGIHLNRLLVRHEPFQDLPLPFRILLSSAAHPQRAWMDSRFEVRIEQGPSSKSLRAQGFGFTSVSFTNPLPPTTSKRHATD